MRNITKCFGQVTANNKVNFNLRKGEVHALLGENGAGKTTLMNIVYGLYEQDEGDLFIGGEKVQINSPRDVISLGVGMVHQHFMLVEPMTILQNVILGLDSGFKKINTLKLRREVQDLCDTYRFNLNVDSKIRDLSVGMQQKVELVKALYRGARILILDEPTAVLTPQEVDDLFEILAHLVKQGKSVVFISHKLWEVMKICERVTVLRQGEVAGLINTRDTTREALAAMMVGREISFEYEKKPVSGMEKLLECSSVSAPGNQLGSGLKGVSFHIKKGEILGLAGVDGNGQTELAEVLMGLRQAGSGKVFFKGRDVTKTGARRRLDMGFAYVPADRLREGLIPDFTVWENLVLNTYNNEPHCRNHVLRPALIKSEGEKLVEEYDVRPRNSGALVRSLSGGNQQKVVIAREFSKEPAFILAVQPTRGLDVGAAQFVHQRLMAEKEKGAAVFLISSDLDEVLAVADRVLVIYEGKIMGEFLPGELSFPEIGMLMGYGGKTVKTREAAL
jgi:simple sugar transport system ATP-binding protein